MKTSKIRLIVVFAQILTAVMCASTGFSQSQETTNRFRLAQSYEQGGDFESAVKLYGELLTIDPSNYVYFEGLRRSYFHLKKYPEAILLIQKRLATAPKDINLLCVLGSAQYQFGQEKEAAASWEQAVAADPSNANVYRLVANTLLENRLLEKTAELYRRARKETGDPNLFAIDLAHLLSVMMDYSGATTEYLRYLQQAPAQFSYVQNRMAQFTGKEDARAAAIAVVRSAQNHPTDPNVNRLLGWLILEGKQFDEAFAVYKIIDKISNAQGAELYAFADRAYNEGAYAVAAAAYKAAGEVPMVPQRLPYAQYGYALASKELSILSDSIHPSNASTETIPESRSHYTSAIENFRSIIARYPQSEFAARSYYQIGLLQFERYFDLDGALASLNSVDKFLPAGNSVRFDVAIKIGEVLTAKGDTSEAMRRFRSVIGAPTATPDQQDEATYRLAEVQYYGGNFSPAISSLDAISANMKADYANDALLLRAFLEENLLSAELSLKEFARAEFLARQKKSIEAITLLQAVVEANPQALFVDDGLMKIALLQSRSGRHREALATYQRLLSQFQESSIALDKAQFNIAELFDYHLKHKESAITAYEKLLAEYPHSLLLDKARKRIRELRGDSL